MTGGGGAAALAAVLAGAWAAGASGCRGNQPRAAAPEPPPPDDDHRGHQHAEGVAARRAAAAGAGPRKPRADEIAEARAAGFPVSFDDCQRAPGATTALWTCAWKKSTGVVHDPALRACAPLLGHPAADDHHVGECHLVFWDPAARLPADYADCKARFLDEPGVHQPRGQELCIVSVSLPSDAAFEGCRRLPFAEVKNGVCRYPLASARWKPRPRASVID